MPSRKSDDKSRRSKSGKKASKKRKGRAVGARPKRPRKVQRGVKKSLAARKTVMATPSFIEGRDKTTFAPFELIDCRDTEFGDVRLSFNDWSWLEKKHGKDSIDGYYLNGYGVEGLVLAARLAAGLEAFPDGMDPNSEGDTCYLHFKDLNVAVETARLGQEMIRDRKKIAAMVAVARENDLED